jgi:hypothetical protein
MKKQKVVPLTYETYLSVIKNSVGSKSFQNYYAEINNKKKDIMKKGELSCAFFVSSILTMFGFLKEVHGTVDSTVSKLTKNGWKEIKKPKPGAVLIWEKVSYGYNNEHKHIGFYIRKNTAVSNNYKLGYPVEHDWRFKGKRKVNHIFWNPKLK